MRSAPASDARLFTFVGGNVGPWRVVRVDGVAGEPLHAPARVSIIAGTAVELSHETTWALRGITSNERYVLREEKTALVNKQEGLGRPASTQAALIPIRKSPAWWALAQDERRAVFEAQSRHVAIGLEHLPGVARRLHHCRDLGPQEPFDFLTWFEFAPSQAEAFDDLVRTLRASPEWQYVEREVDIRLVQEAV